MDELALGLPQGRRRHARAPYRRPIGALLAPCGLREGRRWHGHGAAGDGGGRVEVDSGGRVPLAIRTET